MKHFNNKVNPVFFYVLTWSCVLLLFNLHYSNILLRINKKILVYFFLSCLYFFIPSIVLFSYKYNSPKLRIGNANIRNIKLIALFWIVGVFIELTFFGPFPFFAIFGFNVRPYTEWGFRSYHGLLNGILMSFAIINYGLYLIHKLKHHLIIALLSLLWPVLLMTRQMFISLFIQYFFVYYYMYGIKIKKILGVISIVACVIILFGILGDLRGMGGEDGFLALASPSEEYPDFLPAGFLWFYIYITSPINNIINNIDKYPLLQFSVGDAFGGLLPSSIRSLIIQTDRNNFILVNKYLNVSSCHVDFLGGFGVIGSLFFQCILGFIITLFYMKYKFNRHPKYCFILAILAHNITLSFFTNTFTNLVFLSEIFFVYLYFTKIRK